MRDDTPSLRGGDAEPEFRVKPAELFSRARRSFAGLAGCELCPWRCGVDRRYSSSGRCGSGRLPVVASASLHRGEEPPISGIRGSGTIFFSGCTLACRFCQNWPISRLQVGRTLGVRALADRMLELERRGAHNLNLVTGTHFVPAILGALGSARRRGLRIPVVWNCSGWERLETLQLLDGAVEVYLPDLKYGDDAAAEACSGARGYWATATAAIREMSRQVGTLRLDDAGLATRGLVIRHLVLPGGLAGTERVLEWIAGSLPPGTRVSLMGQYFPAGDAVGDPRLGRPLQPEEYRAACDLLDSFPEIEGWTQDMSLPGGC